MKIQSTQLLHSDLGIYSADASDLGFAPGVWPKSFEMVMPDGRVAFCHAPVPRRDSEGDLQYVDYHSTSVKIRVRIWND